MQTVDPDQTALELGLHCLPVSFCQYVKCTKLRDIYSISFFYFSIKGFIVGWFGWFGVMAQSTLLRSC